MGMGREWAGQEGGIPLNGQTTCFLDGKDEEAGTTFHGGTGALGF